MDKLRLARPDQPLYVPFFEKSLPFLEGLENWESSPAPTADFGQLAGMLENGLADFFVYPLEMVPYQKSENIVVTAIAGRLASGWTLLIHQDFHDAGKILQVPAGGELVVPLETTANWLKQIRPDIRYTILPEAHFFFTGDQLDDTKAWLLPTHFTKANATTLPYWLDRDLLPEELPGLPGQGAIALLAAKDNILVRRKLNQVHQRELVAYCNAERVIDRDLRVPTHEPFLIYCKKADNRPFELYLKMTDEKKGLQSIHLNSGTHLNLRNEVERMLGMKDGG